MTDPQYTLPTFVCRACGVEKPTSAFNRHPNARRGHEATRRQCRYVRRRLDPEFVAAERERGRLRERAKKRTKKRDWSKDKPRDRDRLRARWALANCLRNGTLVRPSACTACGKEGQVQAHHRDYSRPFDVAWLCRDCHAMLHRL